MRQGSSGLTVREYQAYHKPAFQLTPKNVVQWAQNLPIINLGDSSKSTYRLLVDVNQALIDSDKRLSILKAIDPVARNLTTALEKQFMRSHIALTEKQKKIAALVQAIQTELSMGYHAVIESTLTTEAKRLNKKTLATAVALAMKYHGLVMLRSFQLYAPVPDRTWREVYCLYQIARKYELENQSFFIEENKETLVIHHYFIRILLLSVSNPYQLRQQDIQLLWEILSELCQHTTLKSHAYDNHHFVLSLHSSSPPVHKSLHKPGKDASYLKLTTSTIVDHLKQMLISTNQPDQIHSRKSMLLRHLIQCWSHGVNRSFARTPCNESVDVSIGLGATHYLLALDSKTQNVQESSNELEVMEGSLKNVTLDEVISKTQQDPKKDLDYLSSSRVSDTDVWAKLYRPYQATGGQFTEEETGNRSRETIVRDSYKLQKVDLLNMSPAGYCIQITSENLPKHAQTGEVLGFPEADKNGQIHWSIGVVRWVKRQSRNNIIRMGVQLLAPGAIPVDIQLRNSKSGTNEYQRALILPALTGVGQPETLLTNSVSFGVNSKVRILERGQEYDARLSKEVTSSSSFRQFQFEKLKGGKHHKIASESNKNSSFNTQEVDGIWDLI